MIQSEPREHRLPRGAPRWALVVLVLALSSSGALAAPTTRDGKTSAGARPKKTTAHAKAGKTRRAKAAKPEPEARPEAEAQTVSPEKDAARDMAREALELMHQGRWPEAQSLLARAYALVKAPTIALLEGEALEQMGRLLDARDRYEKAKDVGPGTPPEAFVDAARDAEKRAAFLDHRIPKITIVLERDPADIREPVVTLDGLRLAESEWSLPRSVDPGEHVVAASLPGGVAVEDHVLVKETETKEVQLRLTKPVPVRRWNPPIAERSSGSGAKTAAFISLGVGAAGLGVGIASGLVMMNAKSTLDAECRGGCPPSARDDLSRFRTSRFVSLAGYGVGILGLGIGGGLLLFGGSGPPHEPTGTIRIGVGPGTATIRGSF